MNLFLTILAWAAIIACFLIPVCTLSFYVSDWLERRRYLRNLRRDDHF